MANAPLLAVLAAGLGSRYAKRLETGRKLDADCAGKPLGQWVLDAVAAAGLAPGVLVSGPIPPTFAAASGWRVLTNPQPQDGLGGSAAIAAAEALAQGRDLVLLLADMPMITPDFLTDLATQLGAAATRHPDGRPGVPARLPLAILPQAAGLGGDRGAGALLAGLAGLTLLNPPPGMLDDVDTAEDLAKVAALLRPA